MLIYLCCYVIEFIVIATANHRKMTRGTIMMKWMDDVVVEKEVEALRHGMIEDMDDQLNGKEKVQEGEVVAERG